MKKKTFARFGAAAVVSAMLLGTASAFPASAAAETSEIRLMGDLNGDLNVSVSDALGTLVIYVDSRSKLGSNAVSDENYTVDIDMDGEIGLHDAMSILQYYSQSMAGYKPMWADFREVSYIDGSNSFVNPDGSAFVKRDMYIEIGCASGAPGEDVTIPVYVAGLNGLAGSCIWVTPPTGLEPTGITFNTELMERAKAIGKENMFSVSLQTGGAVWITYNGLDQEIADGTVLVEYTYHIPEDAAPGTHYLLTNDPAHTEFVTSYGSIIANYGCTVLSGVVVVK